MFVRVNFTVLSLSAVFFVVNDNVSTWGHILGWGYILGMLALGLMTLKAEQLMAWCDKALRHMNKHAESSINHSAFNRGQVLRFIWRTGGLSRVNITYQYLTSQYSLIFCYQKNKGTPVKSTSPFAGVQD